MRRDLNRIRELLLEAEVAKKPHFSLSQWCADPFDRYQLDLMDEAGLITIGLFTFSYIDPNDEEDKFTDLRMPSLYSDEGFRITWEGHEYLDAVRDDEIWKKTRQGANSIGGFTLGIIKDLATGYIKKEAADKLGIIL